MKGKNRCNILKAVRMKIAEENGIDYRTTECKYQGDCPGTCPKCESEVKYLERELVKRQSLGKRVALAGIAAGITLTAAGCTEDVRNKLGLGEQLQGDVPDRPSESSEAYTMGEERPDDSKVSDIVVDGEMVEVIGEMPVISDDPNLEFTQSQGLLEPEKDWDISDPYADLMGDWIVFDFEINETIMGGEEKVLERVNGWSREFIDYAWKEYIIARDDEKTVFEDEEGNEMTIVYNADGYCESVKIEYGIVEPTMGDLAE